MKKLSAVLALCLLLSGCVAGSLNPFYTEDLVVKQPQLYGSWLFTQDIEANDESPLVIAEGKITLYDDKGVPADARATFFKIDDELFIDVFPNEGRLKQELVNEGEPEHLLSRIKTLGPDKISFNALNYDWLEKQLKAGTVTLPYKMVGSDIVFIAASAQWVEFLKKYKDDPQAFPPDAEAPLVRKK
jgi:hypothetical protein